MLNVHLLSPQNEVRVAERLAAEILMGWPEVANHPADRVDLLVGIRNGTEVDLLIAIDLDEPREVPGKKRAGSAPRFVYSGLIAVEIKQLDPECFERVGNQLYGIYKGVRSIRSCVDQARDGSIGVQNLAASSGFKNLFVHALALLTEVPSGQLRDADPALVGKEAGFREILGAALAQNRCMHSTASKRDAAFVPFAIDF